MRASAFDFGSTAIKCTLRNLFALGFLTFLASPCFATVLEISDDGTFIVHDAAPFAGNDGVPASEASNPSRLKTPPVAIKAMISAAALRHNLSEDLIVEVARRESGFRQSAVSPKNAVGVMQLTSGTAQDLGVDRFDVEQNIDGGARYLRQMVDRFNGDIPLALAAYNAGPGAIQRFKGVPPYAETVNYVGSILDRLSQKAVASVQSKSIGIEGAN